MSTLTFQNPFYLVLIFGGFLPIFDQKRQTAKRQENRKKRQTQTENGKRSHPYVQILTRVAVVFIKQRIISFRHIA